MGVLRWQCKHAPAEFGASTWPGRASKRRIVRSRASSSRRRYRCTGGMQSRQFKGLRGRILHWGVEVWRFTQCMPRFGSHLYRTRCAGNVVCQPRCQVNELCTTASNTYGQGCACLFSAAGAVFGCRVHCLLFRLPSGFAQRHRSSLTAGAPCHGCLRSALPPGSPQSATPPPSALIVVMGSRTVGAQQHFVVVFQMVWLVVRARICPTHADGA